MSDKSLRGPLPPAPLCYRVAGTENPEWFDLSGGITAELYSRCLNKVGRSWESFSHILDWGCGCGRVLRWLPSKAPQARLFGSDIDAAAIEWLGDQYRDVTTAVNAGLPPLPFPGQKFDLILAYSVFTHLNEAYQDDWLEELSRRTTPDAILLLTISSENMWNFTMKSSDHPRLAELQAMREEFDAKGFIFWDNDGWEAHFPDFYHTTFHSHEYIKRHWSKWFRVLYIHEGTPEMPQEVVVLSKK
jgi:hypothetical protein